MKKILFISHEATLTGAPILLLRLIEQIKKHSNLEIIILLKEGGELENHFEALGTTFVWNRPVPEIISFTERWRNRIYRTIGKPTYTKQQLYKAAILKEVAGAAIVFNNTIANTDLLKALPIKNKQIFCYIHELRIVTQMLATKEDIRYLENLSHKIFVPALAVKDFFVKQYQVPESKIVLLPYIIPQQDKKAVHSKLFSKKPGGGQFLAGFCGSLDERKGFDLLPLLARKIIVEKNVTDIHFVWIGVNKNSFNFLILQNDLAKLKLESYFTFIETQPDVQPWLAQLDLFVLPSREDPFPLVVLEAACYEVPCIYFKDAGGIAAFCGDDAGIGVEYLDIDAMADAIVGLKKDDAFRVALGKKAKQKVEGYSESAFDVQNLLKYFKTPAN